MTSAGSVNVGGVLSPTVTLAFEISKNTFPTASILNLAVALYIQGISTSSLPSFAVFRARLIGKVFPPSYDRRILTLAASASEPFTDQVIVWGPGQTVVALLKLVIANGPAVPSMVSVMSS